MHRDRRRRRGGPRGALALRELAGAARRHELLAPDREFTYRPLSVAEPFGLGHATRYELQAIGADRGFTVVRDTLAAVEPHAHRVVTQDGDGLVYDRLLLALGARPRRAIEGALAFRGPQDAPRIADGLNALGARRRVVFAVPPPCLGAADLRARAADGALGPAPGGAPELTVVTPEARPLEVFGHSASAEVAPSWPGPGISFLGGVVPRDVVDGALELGGGERVPADLVITLPRLDGPAVHGLPNDAAASSTSTSTAASSACRTSTQWVT